MKIGILGIGHLGKIHLKCIKELSQFQLVGFYDPDIDKAFEAEKEFGIKRFSRIDDLIDSVDIVDIVTPTVSHFECAEKALKKSKHVFIEKPLTTTLSEARELMEIAHEANVKVQVGHVERFNPAFIAAYPYINKPMFIESHRLALFNPRGTDVSVILDLMIHDIDIILNVIGSTVKRISASGVSVVSETPDIANARIEFHNGAVANLTVSRISLKNMRKMRLFQKDAYISVDFLNKESEIVRMQEIDGDPDPLAAIIDFGSNKPKKQLLFDKPEIKPINAIMKELEAFHESITNNLIPTVTIFDGYNALELAYKIIEKIKEAMIND